MDANQDFSMPSPQASDSNEVQVALTTAQSLWGQDQREALRWLRKAAEGASDAGDDLRSVQLARAAADLRNLANIGPTVPPPHAAAPVALANGADAVAPPAPETASSATSTQPGINGQPELLGLGQNPAQTVPATPAAAAAAALQQASAAAQAAGSTAVEAAADTAPHASVPSHVNPQLITQPTAERLAEQHAANQAVAAQAALAAQQAAAQQVAAQQVAAQQAAAAQQAQQLAAQAAAQQAAAQQAAAQQAAAQQAAAQQAAAQQRAQVSPGLAAQAARVGAARPSASAPQVYGSSGPGSQRNTQPIVNGAGLAAAAPVVNEPVPQSVPPSAPFFVTHRTVRVALSPAPNAEGEFSVHPLAEGESAPPGWKDVLLVALDPAERLFPGRN